MYKAPTDMAINPNAIAYVEKLSSAVDAGLYVWERNAAKSGWVTSVDDLTVEIYRSANVPGIKFTLQVRDERGQPLVGVSEAYDAEGIPRGAVIGLQPA